MMKMYARGTSGFFLVFDLSDQASFKSLERRFEDIENYGINIPTLLVGAKSDLKRVVEQQTARDFASARGMDYIETSSKDGTNVELAFKQFSSKLLNEGPAIPDRASILEKLKKEPLATLENIDPLVWNTEKHCQEYFPPIRDFLQASLGKGKVFKLSTPPTEIPLAVQTLL